MKRSFQKHTRNQPNDEAGLFDVSQALSEAKNYAYRLIKFRLRSERELRDKLEGRGYHQEVIEQVVLSLKKTKMLDDRLFARLWVDSRIKRHLSLSRLKHELRNKGVENSLIEEAVERHKDSYDERAVIKEIIARRSERMQNLVADKMRSRLFGFLVRRGYSKGLVMELLLER